MTRHAACLALLVLLASASAWALPSKTWVLSIGNNAGDLSEVELLYAERDARQIAQTLQRHGGVNGVRVRTVFDAKAPEVRKALLDVNEEIRAKAGKENSALIVYYSGHADATDLHLGGTHLAFDELRSLVAGSSAKMRILVVDACRSGSVTRVKGVTQSASFDLQLKHDTLSEGMVIITSSTAGESSQESDELRGSFFSHHLVNALRGAADADEDQRVTLDEAYSYAYNQTVRSTGRTVQVQHPTYKYDVKGRGEIVLASKSEAKTLGHITLHDPSKYLVAERREGGAVVAELATSHPKTTLSLPARSYFVQARGDSEYKEYAVKLARGQTVDLSGLPYRSVAYDRLVRKRGGSRRYAHNITVLGAGRGETIEGVGATASLVIGYGLDLPWFTVQLRGRGASTPMSGPHFNGRHDELAMGLTLQRFVDFRHLSFSFGLLTEAAWNQQLFAPEGRTAPTRTSWSGAFGGLLALERPLSPRWSLRLEGGPITYLYQRDETIGRAPSTLGLDTPLTWWSAAGLVWRL